MYWNFLPDTPGFNNPGSGPNITYAGSQYPLLNHIAQAVSDWSSVQSKYLITYKTGGWIDETDMFV